MGVMASQITSLASVYSTVYLGVDQRKHQSSASLAFVCGIHRGPVNSPHKGPVTRKMFPFDDVIMKCKSMVSCQKGPTRHAYAWQIGPFWQDTLEMCLNEVLGDIDDGDKKKLFSNVENYASGNPPLTGGLPPPRSYI